MFKRFATNHPVLFSVLITLSVLVFYVAAGVFGAAVRGDVGGNLAQAIGRFFAAGCFVYLLWRFDWLDASGVTWRGTAAAWLVTLVLVVYETVAYQLVFFGDLSFEISNPGVSIAVGLNALATGPLEEIPFRGIILCAFLSLWGDSRKGIVRSVLYSAVLFGCSHIIHIAFGRPPDMVAMKMFMTCLSGIYFAALVLRWRTIWTVVLFHGVLNAVLSIRAVEVAGFAETAPALGMMALLQVPLVAFGDYLIWKAPLRQGVPNAS